MMAGVGRGGVGLQSSLAMVLNALEIDPRRTWKVRLLWARLGSLADKTAVAQYA
jgi:hypothetical protein